jgi:predicted branched-subunit amino acid permease
MNSLQAEQAAREKEAFWDGVRISAPTMPGLVAWGAVTGMVMVQSGLSVWQAILMTVMVYAAQRNWRSCP